MDKIACRFCNAPLTHMFADLGSSPIANNILSPNNLLRSERFYPLGVYVCDSCFLVQLPEYEDPEHIFTDYTYFSSYSDSWLRHARDYVEMVIERFGFDQHSHVVELASNDGYLLQYFKEKDVPILGVEPAENVAKVAIEHGIPTVCEFFGAAVAKGLGDQHHYADLIIGNNVLAHVPDINDFVGGMRILLKPNGVITMEFPHLLKLIELRQFDTIYHEHFSYLSFATVQEIFRHHGLVLFDVEQIPTHGGSLRIFGKHEADGSKRISESVLELLNSEMEAGLTRLDTYLGFQEKISKTKRELLRCLIEVKDAGKSVVGYGAPAKGNTLLNFCGIRGDFVDYTVDRSPYKQGQFLPGTRIPIFAPDKIYETKPDYMLILPWNLKDEIVGQMSGIREWGGRFIVPIPGVEVLD
jgi:2-polyprenyl-3-methyl-5-hydroxy-6-metoxy-1,4-benzoquinol methylase